MNLEGMSMMGDILGSIGGQLVEWVLPALATAISALVVRFLSSKAKQAGIELTEAQEARLREVVQGAIRAAEEVSRRDETLTSSDKRLIAAKAVAAKLPESDPLEVERIIDEELPVVRPTLDLSPPKPKPRTPADLGR